MSWLQHYWYRYSLFHLILFPISLLFRVAVVTRRYLYSAGLFKAHALPAPVVVIGNISVGGTGKTPLVLYLAQSLRDKGMSPGIISRGYGGTTVVPHPVFSDSDPRKVGDEAVLLARKSNCPVWVGKDRFAAGAALLSHHTDCNIILSDDGLQHYGIKRDVEVAVIDATRLFGNQLLLPAGPLREPISRLKKVDAVVLNGSKNKVDLNHLSVFSMTFRQEVLYNLQDPNKKKAIADLKGLKIAAVAGIGHPQRFFDTLNSFGLSVTGYAFPDHYCYKAHDVQFADADIVLMTEKDAVKCASFNNDKIWVVAIAAELDADLADFVLTRIKTHESKITRNSGLPAV